METNTSSETLGLTELVVLEYERKFEELESQIREEIRLKYEPEVQKRLKPLIEQLDAAKLIAEKLADKPEQTYSKQTPVETHEGLTRREPKRSTGSVKKASSFGCGKTEDPVWTQVASEISYDEVTSADVLQILEQLGVTRTVKQVQKKLFNWKKGELMKSPGRGLYTFTAEGRSQYGIPIPERGGNVHHLRSAGGTG